MSHVQAIFRAGVGDDDGNISVRHTVSIHANGQADGVRIILDPYGEDHDVLIERRVGHWQILVHPQGSDPVCVVHLNPQKAVVYNLEGDEIARATF